MHLHPFSWFKIYNMTLRTTSDRGVGGGVVLKYILKKCSVIFFVTCLQAGFSINSYIHVLNDTLKWIFFPFHYVLNHTLKWIFFPFHQSENINSSLNISECIFWKLDINILFPIVGGYKTIQKRCNFFLKFTKNPSNNYYSNLLKDKGQKNPPELVSTIIYYYY